MVSPGPRKNNMDSERIKSKMKKLLALSSSPNPHEAAAALEAAQKLMAEYNIDAAGVNRLDITEEACKTIYRKNTPPYENKLIVLIGNAFGCRSIYQVNAGCRWTFIGLSHRAQVAAYIAQVLLRKLRAARSEYIKTLRRVRSRHRKTRRADAFCSAWVNAVTEKLFVFAGSGPEEDREIEIFIQENHPNLTGMQFTRRPTGTDGDYHTAIIINECWPTATSERRRPCYRRWNKRAPFFV
jgi:hypothetical protein